MTDNRKIPTQQRTVIDSSNDYANAEIQLKHWQACDVDCHIEPLTLRTQVIYEVVSDYNPRVGGKS